MAMLSSDDTSVSVMAAASSSPVTRLRLGRRPVGGLPKVPTMDRPRSLGHGLAAVPHAAVLLGMKLTGADPFCMGTQPGLSRAGLYVVRSPRKLVVVIALLDTFQDDGMFTALST